MRTHNLLVTINASLRGFHKSPTATRRLRDLHAIRQLIAAAPCGTISAEAIRRVAGSLISAIPIAPTRFAHRETFDLIAEQQLAAGQPETFGVTVALCGVVTLLAEELVKMEAAHNA